MAHPFHEHRAHKVEKSRVGHITKGYASGGAVVASPKRASGGKVSQSSLMKEEDAQAVQGGSAKERMDRPGRSMKKDGGAVNRARGGRLAPAKAGVRHKGKININVLNAPQAHPGMAPGGPPPMAGPMMPPHPPMPPPGGAPMPPPGGPPMAPPGMGAPGGMPIRSSGGRAYARGGGVKPAPAKAGDGPAWKEGLRDGTQVQNNPSGKNDQRDVGRGKPITFKTGGKVEAPQGVSSPHLPGGSGGGKARLAKEKMASHGKSGMAP
jgi:hypothetical protein